MRQRYFHEIKRFYFVISITVHTRAFRWSSDLGFYSLGTWEQFFVELILVPRANVHFRVRQKLKDWEIRKSNSHYWLLDKLPKRNYEKLVMVLLNIRKSLSFLKRKPKGTLAHRTPVTDWAVRLFC